MQALSKPSSNVGIRLPEMLHVIVGGGGSRILLEGFGFIIALILAGITADNCASIGGSSGGSIVAAIFAAKKTLSQILCYALECDFSALFKTEHGFWHMAFKVFENELGIETLDEGALDSQGLGDVITQEISDKWVPKFWTNATHEESEIVFDEHGAWEYRADGGKYLIASKPVPLAFAIQASTSIPIVMEPQQFHDRTLQDGCIAKGRCPTATAVQHLGAKPEHILACGHHCGPGAWLLFKTGKHLVGNHQPTPETHGLVVDMSSRYFSWLDFKIAPAKKRATLLYGYNKTIATLHNNAWLSDADCDRLAAYGRTFESLAAACEAHSTTA